MSHKRARNHLQMENTYNYETHGDLTVFDCPKIPDEKYHSILQEEVGAAVKQNTEEG